MSRRAALALTLILAPGGATAGEPVRLDGTGIELMPPSGMVPSEGFAGFLDPDKGSAMLVVELPVVRGELGEFLTVLSEGALAGSGLTQLDRGALAEGVPDNLLIRTEHLAHGIPFERWIYIAPGERRLAMITVQLPQQFASEDAAAELRASLASVRIQSGPASAAVDSAALDALPFAYAAGGRFTARSVIAGDTVVLHAASASDRTEAILLISKSPAPGGQDRLERSTAALEALEGVDEIAIDDAFAEVAVGELAGVELTARCVEKGTGAPCFAYQMMLFDTDAGYRVLGLTHADLAETYLPEFRRIAQSLAPR